MKILNLEKRIMWRVYLLYTIRKLKAPFVLELLVICSLSLYLSFLVSVPSVFSNILLTHASFNFISDALLKASVIVKLILVSAIIAGIFFVKDLGKFTSGVVKTRFV